MHVWFKSQSNNCACWTEWQKAILSDCFKVTAVGLFRPPQLLFAKSSHKL